METTVTFLFTFLSQSPRQIKGHHWQYTKSSQDAVETPEVYDVHCK